MPKLIDTDVKAALIAALFDGVAESPLWSTFLELLRGATGAEYATLIFLPPGRKMGEALHLMAGEAAPLRLQRFFQEESVPSQRSPNQTEGQPYSLKQLLDVYPPSEAVFYRALMARHGIGAVRQMRLREPTGVDAWLTVSRLGSDFGENADALFRMVAPVLRGVLQLYVAMERERAAASHTAEAIRRLQFGWISLDHTGRIIDCDEQGALVLSSSRVIARGANDRLTAARRDLDREIVEALERVVEKPDSRPRAITLNREPWLDMLLVPATRTATTASQTVAAIAYVHGDNWGSSDRHEQLAELFNLSPRESRLALAISRGLSLAEAAEEFGLTIATARTYSKSIYAKTGARGLPDLVRIVMRSVLAIAPHD